MAKSNRMFSSTQRAKVLALVVGKPTGVIAEVGGLEFNLLPFNTAEGLGVFALLKKFADLFDDIREQKVTEATIARAISNEGENILNLMRSMLKRSAFVDERDADEAALFEEWFSKIDLVSTVRALVPKVIEANGIGGLLGNATPPQTAAEPATESTEQDNS